MRLTSTPLYMQASSVVDVYCSWRVVDATSTIRRSGCLSNNNVIVITAPDSGKTAEIEFMIFSNPGSSTITVSLYLGSDENGSKIGSFSIASQSFVQYVNGAGFSAKPTTVSSSSSSSSASTISLADSQILVGNSEGAASPVSVSGAITIDNSGVTTLTDSTNSAGTYNLLTVNKKGIVTHGQSVTTLSQLGITDGAKSGANDDITSLAALTTPLSIEQGGTGSSNIAQARAALESAQLGQNSDITSLSGLQIPLSINQGGTGANSADTACTNLGLRVGSNVQAHSDELDGLSNFGVLLGLVRRTGYGVFTIDETTYLSSTLGAGKLFVGNASGVATGVTISGDATLNSSGKITVTGANGVQFSKLATDTSANYLTGTIPTSCVYGEYTRISGVGVITTGTWRGSIVDVSYGGTGSTLVASGPGILVQTALGSVVTTLPLTAAQTIIADANGVPASVAISGDATIDVTGALSLSTSGVIAGTYNSITVDTKGRVTGGTNPTTLAGYGITDALSASLASAKFYLGNASGAAAAVSMSGDAAMDASGAVTVGKIGGYGVTLSGSFAMSGAYSFVGTLVGNTDVTFPTSGTLAVTNIAQTFSAKQTINVSSNPGLTVTSSGGTGTIASFSGNGNMGMTFTRTGTLPGSCQFAVTSYGSSLVSADGACTFQANQSGTPVVVAFDVNGDFHRSIDNVGSLGTGSYRWKSIYLGLNTPASSSASGSPGQVMVDADYIYVCTAANTWKRTALSTW